ncbi:hypothetical protein [Paenibacillus daejeonensis]|uniref:hypothetical protein n=1 Tax=Paenibacillus daejeonensis TaxID=135193 RepID=UPI0012F9F78A|nr:hypothetical protein [Paenibacillus daejeonensis]
MKNIMEWLGLTGGMTGILLLQLFLLKQHKRLGFILPIATFLLAILALPGWVAYLPDAWTNQSFMFILERVGYAKVAEVLNGMYVFALYNLPTVLLLLMVYAVHGGTRRHNRLEREMDLMRVEDLND